MMALCDFCDNPAEYEIERRDSTTVIVYRICDACLKLGMIK